jgi:hypothetical protein
MLAAKPRNIEFLEEFRQLVIRRRWFTPVAFFLVFFCIFWDGFLFVWYGIAFGQEDAPLMMVLFPLLHVAVGIGLTYYTICLFVNRTDIRIDTNTLEVRHHPLPWPGQSKTPVHKIRQPFVKERISQTKNGQTITYQVEAILDDASAITLIRSLPNREEARYIERKLEEVLGLEDLAVDGEDR